jgi:hypothetical protein
MFVWHAHPLRLDSNRKFHPRFIMPREVAGELQSPLSGRLLEGVIETSYYLSFFINQHTFLLLAKLSS